MLTGFTCGFGGACDCVGYHAIPCSEEELQEAVEIGKENLLHNFQNVWGLLNTGKKSLKNVRRSISQIKGCGKCSSGQRETNKEP
eukprot:UN13762